MAARRLLIVMLVFLGISSVLAVFAPPPVERDSEPATTSSTSTSAAASAAGSDGGGRLIRRRISAPDDGGRRASGKRSRRTITMRPGDQLALLVDVPGGGDVSIPSLGLREITGPAAPARFDIYATAPGRHPVRVIGSDLAAAMIIVKPVQDPKGD